MFPKTPKSWLNFQRRADDESRRQGERGPRRPPRTAEIPARPGDPPLALAAAPRHIAASARRARPSPETVRGEPRTATGTQAGNGTQTGSGAETGSGGNAGQPTRVPAGRGPGDSSVASGGRAAVAGGARRARVATTGTAVAGDGGYLPLLAQSQKSLRSVHLARVVPPAALRDRATRLTRCRPAPRALSSRQHPRPDVPHERQRAPPSPRPASVVLPAPLRCLRVPAAALPSFPGRPAPRRRQRAPPRAPPSLQRTRVAVFVLLINVHY